MRYSRLNAKQKAMVNRAIGISVRALQRDVRGSVALGKGYEAVTMPFSAQRRPSVVELTGEDGILGHRDRSKLTNMHRDMVRNSPTRVSQDQQVRVNVVGNVGGKVYANFPDGFEDAAEEVRTFVNRKWGRHCEFSFGHDFNWVLKTALSSMDTDGNVILVFDDGILSGGNGTGRIRAFEGDEIANLKASDFSRFFDETHVQSQGFVYDQLGRFVGCFVSSSQRGVAEFDVKKKSDEPSFEFDKGVLVLRRDPVFSVEPNWVKIGEERRFNQGRAVSSLSAAINCLVDLHETVASESQAAKINAQLVGQILRDASADIDDEAPGFEDAADGDSTEMPKTVEFTTKELSAIGAHLDQMPEGLKVDLFDTKRPNPNIEAYIEFLSGLAGGTRGLARVYSTMRAQTSYTAYRGEQAITQPTFEEKQKMLEREVCDPLVRLAIRWGVKVGEIKAELPDGWESMLSFVWPEMPEIDEVKAQNAIALKLKNGLTSLHRLMKPGEYDAVRRERQQEIADYKADGLVYPGAVEVSETQEGEESDEQ